MTDQETYLLCPCAPQCAYEQWISPEDEDASFSDLWDHVQSRHTSFNSDATIELMIKAKEIKR